MDYLRTQTEKYARFEDGSIDYTNERVCFVLNCVVVFGDDVLLVRRGGTVGTYPNTLSGISGYLDNPDVSVEEQAKIELQEELTLNINAVERIAISEPFIQIDESIEKEWHVYAVLVELHERIEPTINWENKSAEWLPIETAKQQELMPGFDKTLQVALSLRSK